MSTNLPATQINKAIAVMQTEDFKKQLSALLPVHVKVDQFISVARRGIHGNKALNFDKMNTNTLYSSVLKAAEQGLKLDGEEAALVQYGDSVQFMKMIKGVKKQLRNSGEIKEITAEVVYKNDKFEYWVDDKGKHIKHSPNFLEDRGELVAAYSVITTKDGGLYIKVMSKQEIEAVQKSSKTGSASFSPWNGPFKSEMWCKTVLRRNAKDAPTSTDLPEVFKDWDEDFDFSNKSAVKEVASNLEDQANKKKTSRLEKIVEAESEDFETQVEPQNTIAIGADSDSIPI
jgi:recombination protein RecT